MTESFLGVVLIVLAYLMMRRNRLVRDRDDAVIDRLIAEKGVAYRDGTMEMPDEEVMARAGNRAWVPVRDAQDRGEA